MDEICKVRDFHVKFGLPDGNNEDYLLEGKDREELVDFRTKFMREELEEFEQAIADGDDVKAFDALLDLTYVVFGTALMMGITPAVWHRGFSKVHKCNMTKVRVKVLSDSKRSSKFDVIKPEGWVGPEEYLKAILRLHQVEVKEGEVKI